MIRSKLSFKALLVVGCLMICIYLGIEFCDKIIYHKHRAPIPIMILLFVMSWSAVAWLFWGDLRQRMIAIKIDTDTVSVTTFGGLGIRHNFPNSQIDGYTTSFVPRMRGGSRCIYLYSSRKRVIRISDTYQRNYRDLWKVIKVTYKDLGYERFEFFKELKDCFS